MIMRWILSLFGCRHAWTVIDESYDCRVEQCTRCGSERYKSLGDVWET